MKLCDFDVFWVWVNAKQRSERKMSRSSGGMMEHWSMYNCCVKAVGRRKRIDVLVAGFGA